MFINIKTVSEKPTIIDECLNFDETFLNNSPIKKLDNVKVLGKIWLNYSRDIEYSFQISGVMVLVDAYSLSDYEYEFKTEVNEILNNDDIFFNKTQNTLDIMEILWQNIVLEVPIRVGDDPIPEKHGEGWELVSENSKKIDPRLACLKELLDDKKEV